MVEESSSPTATDAATPDVLALLEAGPVLLYDGECGVCAASVQWILRHERTRDLRFAALQSDIGRQLREAAGTRPTLDSLVWVGQPVGSVGLVGRSHSSAVIATLRYVGGGWGLLARVLWLIPKPLRDLAYRAFAAIRRSIAPTRCLLPSAEERVRFLSA